MKKLYKVFKKNCLECINDNKQYLVVTQKKWNNILNCPSCCYPLRRRVCIPSSWKLLLEWRFDNPLFVCSYVATASFGWLYFNYLYQNFAIFEHGTIKTVFKRSLDHNFVANFDVVWLSVITAKCFAIQTSQFCAEEVFFEKARFSSIVLFMLSKYEGKSLLLSGAKIQQNTLLFAKSSAFFSFLFGYNRTSCARIMLDRRLRILL